MVFGDKTVVEVIIFDLEKNGLSVYVVSTLQEVHSFGGDEHAVAIDVLHGYEAAWESEHMMLSCSGSGPGLSCSKGQRPAEA